MPLTAIEPNHFHCPVIAVGHGSQEDRGAIENRAVGIGWHNRWIWREQPSFDLQLLAGARQNRCYRTGASRIVFVKPYTGLITRRDIIGRRGQIDAAIRSSEPKVGGDIETRDGVACVVLNGT